MKELFYKRGQVLDVSKFWIFKLFSFSKSSREMNKNFPLRMNTSELPMQNLNSPQRRRNQYDTISSNEKKRDRTPGCLEKKINKYTKSPLKYIQEISYST